MKANWDHKASGYVDNFVPFAVSALCVSGIDRRTAAEVRDVVSSDFGLDLPDNVVKTVLRRAVKVELAVSDRQYFVATAAAQEARSHLLEQQVKLARRRTALVDALMAEAQAVDMTVSSDEAESALVRFIERHAVPLLRMLVRRQSPTLSNDVTEPGLEYLVSRFATRVLEHDPVLSEYLEDVVKGSMLAVAMYLAPGGAVDRRFDRTALYLDTPLILKVLGHEGSLAKRAVAELVQLAKGAGASIVCFDHSVSEAKGVLHSVAGVLASGRRPPVVRGVLAHCLETGATSSDVLEHVGSLERELERLRIEVKARPDHEVALTVDEKALADAMRERIHYTYEASLQHDLNSLTAIHRLRRGRVVEQVERCGALLITNNASLVAEGNRFFRQEESASIGPAMLDHEISTLLWLKKPMAAPDLPRSQILADSYAALDPGPVLWQRYMDEIDRLSSRGELDAEEVVELRFSIEAHRLLMERTHTNPNRVSGDVVGQVLRQSRELASQGEREQRLLSQAKAAEAQTRAGGLEHKLAETQARLTEVREELGEVKQRHLDQVESVKRLAVEQIRRRVRTVAVIVAAVGVVITVVTWFGGVDTVPNPLRAIIKWVGLALSVGGILTMCLGGSVWSLARKAEQPLVNRRQRTLLQRAGLDE